jgi:hypothetical protein
VVETVASARDVSFRLGRDAREKVPARA